MTAPTDERPPRRLGEIVGAPLVAFAVTRLASVTGALLAGVNPFRAASWVRWDSLWYLRIAAGGYRLEPCPGGRSMFCGTTGWFPGYPTLIALLSHLRVAPEVAGLLISALAQLGFLLVLRVWFLEKVPPRRRWALLLLAALFPGAIYAQALFPISTLVLLVLVFLAAVRHGRPGLAAAAGAGAAFTYPTGCLLAPVYGVWLLASGGQARGDWRRLLPLLGPLLGLGAVLAVMGVQTGTWDAFFRNQVQGFGYGLSDPLASLWRRLVPLVVWRRAGLVDVVTACQTALVLVLVGTAGAEAIRARTDPTTALMGLTVAAYWLFPLLIGGSLSLYRVEATLLPAVWLLRAAPASVLGLLLAAAGALTIPMAWAFFQGTLV